MNDKDFLFWLQGVLEVKVKFNGSKQLEEILKDVREHNEGGKTAVVSGSLPSVDEAGVMAVKISEMVEPPLTAQEQSFFIAGFCECVKWLGSNDR